ncbi:MAG: hypothetical protein ACHQQQ_04600 [Bacteroidota bacterium]
MESRCQSGIQTTGDPQTSIHSPHSWESLGHVALADLPAVFMAGLLEKLVVGNRVAHHSVWNV